jgi:hypothetical protein
MVDSSGGILKQVRYNQYSGPEHTEAQNAPLEDLRDNISLLAKLTDIASGALRSRYQVEIPLIGGSLGGVRTYISSDPFHYDVDNRPLRDLQENLVVVRNRISSVEKAIKERHPSFSPLMDDEVFPKIRLYEPNDTYHYETSNRPLRDIAEYILILLDHLAKIEHYLNIPD